MSKRNSNQIIQQQQSIMYAGPLPPSNEFGGYEQVMPGAANRILTLAEQESEHRRKNEDKIVQHSIKKKQLRTDICFYSCAHIIRVNIL